MKALRVQVERVVRPIRASSLRKDRMREELLHYYERELTYLRRMGVEYHAIDPTLT